MTTPATPAPSFEPCRFGTRVSTCYHVPRCHHQVPGDQDSPFGREPDPAAGPLCDRMEWEGHCGHPTCHKIDDTLPDLTECPAHGAQEVTGGGSGTGYAGGRIHWLDLACGCTQMDESGDIAAAI